MNAGKTITIRHEVTYPHPQEHVWVAITDPHANPIATHVNPEPAPLVLLGFETKRRARQTRQPHDLSPLPRGPQA